jgi:L-amino acid N-acyltransferase YncA
LPDADQSRVRIRDAGQDDAATISAIYNDTVSTTTVAWTEEHESLATRREWLEKQAEAGYPVLVAELGAESDAADGDPDGDARVIGFASYGEFRNATKWPGYRFTVEHTIHIDAAHQGSGVGGALLEALVARATAAGLHVMIGAIDGENDGSIRFHERHGFAQVARLPAVGFKFGRWLDLVLVQRTLS